MREAHELHRSRELAGEADVADAPARRAVERHRAGASCPATARTARAGAYLNGVSCVGATDCYAVGNYISPYTRGLSLVEHWNGATWSIVRSPSPPRAVSTTLSGVSCTRAAATTCWAVGNYSTKVGGDPQLTVTERLQHGKWAIVASPNASGGRSSSLNAVSCTSASNCYAVGVRQHRLGASLIEHWNGARWTIVSNPNPAGFSFSQLLGVSCTGSSSCVAVGTYTTDSPGGSTLIEQLQGARWTVEPSPNHTDAASNALAGASCVGTGQCFTVGTYLQSTFANPAAGFTEQRS